jgi:hypothetical protein
MPHWHRPQGQPQGRHRHETHSPATLVARHNGMASNGFKIALCINAKGQRKGWRCLSDRHKKTPRKGGAGFGYVVVTS